MVRPSITIGLLLGFGAFVVVLAAIAIVFWPTIFSNQLNKQLALTNTSQSYDIWKEIPIPMYLEFFLWNITNYQDILDGTDDRIVVEQKGPYVYRESHTKINLVWNDNHTVTFNNKRAWHFVPEMTNGTLEDNITSINVVIATAGYALRHQNAFLNAIINLGIRAVHENMFVTKTVTEWIFDGYDDPLIDLAHQWNIPIDIPYTKFGWFVDRNESETYDGTFNMHTGTDNIERLGEVSAWNYQTHTGYYSGDCGRVQGSMGELWPPETYQDEVTVFASDLCSHLTLHIAEDVTVEGVTGVRYRANESLFDNGYNYPSLACFCEEDRDSGDCPLPGALNVSMCRYGAPAFVSQPHFRGANPYYTRNIVGMAPNASHDFTMGLELFTGIPLEVQAQLQINILIRRVPGLSILNIFPEDIYVPMFWFRQEMQMTEDYASLARRVLFWHAAGGYIFYAILGVGLVLLVAGFAVLAKMLYKGSDTVPLIREETVQ